MRESVSPLADQLEPTRKETASKIEPQGLAGRKWARCLRFESHFDKNCSLFRPEFKGDITYHANGKIPLYSENSFSAELLLARSNKRGQLETETDKVTPKQQTSSYSDLAGTIDRWLVAQISDQIRRGIENFFGMPEEWVCLSWGPHVLEVSARLPITSGSCRIFT